MSGNTTALAQETIRAFIQGRLHDQGLPVNIKHLNFVRPVCLEDTVLLLTDKNVASGEFFLFMDVSGRYDPESNQLIARTGTYTRGNYVVGRIAFDKTSVPIRDILEGETAACFDIDPGMELYLINPSAKPA